MPPLGQQQPLDRQRLGEIVAERLGEWITERQLKPGDRLPSEPELSQHFGVARSVVREALSKLKTLGVIEVFQGKGAFVAKLPIELLFMRVRRLNPSTIDETHLWELREILETRTAALAAERRTREDLLTLEVAIRDMGEPRLGGIENERFHRALAQAAHNPLLEQLVSELVTLSESFLEKAHQQDPNRVGKAREEHALILEAVRASDAKKASATMRKHLRNALGWFADDAFADDTEPEQDTKKLALI
jgi:GntR family transcriptional regulator, transcriptional repressor for pyruvate dehydrogenase complex